jgi:hypothetical protein
MKFYRIPLATVFRIDCRKLEAEAGVEGIMEHDGGLFQLGSDRDVDKWSAFEFVLKL